MRQVLSGKRENLGCSANAGAGGITPNSRSGHAPLRETTDRRDDKRYITRWSDSNIGWKAFRVRAWGEAQATDSLD